MTAPECVTFIALCNRHPALAGCLHFDIRNQGDESLILASGKRQPSSKFAALFPRIDMAYKTGAIAQLAAGVQRK